MKKRDKKEMNAEQIKNVNRTLRQYSKDQLIEQCKQHSKSTVGNKHDLAMRLLGYDQLTVNNKKKSVESSVPIIYIYKNKKGQYVHPETSLVFNRETKRVIGVCKDDEVIALTRKEITLCRQYKFDYDIPENLDVKDEYYELLVDESKRKVENTPEEVDQELDEDFEEEEEEDAISENEFVY